MLAVITPVFIPQTKYTEHSELARPAVGVCQVTQREKCWSQLMVRAERGNTDTGAEWPLQTAATADQLRVALV